MTVYPGMATWRNVVPFPGCLRPTRTTKKKADVAEYLEVFDHVGLFCDRPPGLTELPFV